MSNETSQDAFAKYQMLYQIKSIPSLDFLDFLGQSFF